MRASRSAAITAMAAAFGLQACTTTLGTPPLANCGDGGKIGLFDPSRDLLVANYDSKPDVDDLQAVAGLGTVLAHPDFACVDYIAT